MLLTHERLVKATRLVNSSSSRGSLEHKINYCSDSFSLLWTSQCLDKTTSVDYISAQHSLAQSGTYYVRIKNPPHMHGLNRTVTFHSFIAQCGGLLPLSSQNYHYFPTLAFSYVSAELKNFPASFLQGELCR